MVVFCNGGSTAIKPNSGYLIRYISNVLESCSRGDSVLGRQVGEFGVFLF